MEQEKTKADIEPRRWVSRYADGLYAYALTRTGLPQLAEDLVQDTFLSGLEKIGTFQGRSSEKTWLNAILRNKIADYFRQKETAVPIPSEVDFFDPGTGHWNPEHYPEKLVVDDAVAQQMEELGKILALCMNKLPPLWLAAFSMRSSEEIDTRRICEQLSITPSNFWVVTHRAKLHLRACLEKNWLN